MGVDTLSVYINKNCITAQTSECLVPLLPHQVLGQRGVSDGAMHESSEMEVP
jgi:hypothetical protein